MEFTARARKNALIRFMKSFKESFKPNIPFQDMFAKQYIAKGVEGEVYKATFTNNFTFILKTVNLEKIQNSKDICKVFLNKKPNQVYKEFLSTKSFKNPSLIELISQMLTNQLVLQKICPHFSMNYYWVFENKTLFTCNEYANFEDFHSWAQKKHSDLIWFNALFQIMTGLISIKQYFNMLHTDFHTKNILVQKVVPGGYWTYTIDNFKYYVPNLGYVFLIHDFGFAWIPNTMQIKWHYSDTLSYITKTGMNYYDISTWLHNVRNTKSYKVPQYFSSIISQIFSQDDIKYILSKQYYQDQLDHHTQINKDYLKYKLETYPNIKESYTGTKTTLVDKLYSLFYNPKYASSPEFEIHHVKYSNKDFHTKNTFKLESYSLDKNFDKSKLPKSFQKLVKQ